MSHPSTSPLIDPDLRAALDRAIQGDDLATITGLLIVRHGQPVLEAYYRNCDPRTFYNVKSVAKSVLSLLVGIALERGDLRSLNLRLVEVLPELAELNADPRTREITLEHLLTMTSGFRWQENGPLMFEMVASENWVHFILSLDLTHEPGTHFTYTTAGSHLLSAALSRATGQSTLAFAAEHLFAPLGVDTTSCVQSPITITNGRTEPESPTLRWSTDPQGVVLGGVELFLRPGDLAKIGTLILNRGRWKDTQIVPAAWIEAATRHHVDTSVPDYSGYGYQWWLGSVAGHPTFVAAGYGGQRIYVTPDLDLVVVVMAKTDLPIEEMKKVKDASFLFADLIVPALSTD
jgi:CubicO group peptidase (beta-lactamase class C family)